ncbi:hypothetical protein [Acetanaerobacterium elongatum]|uniref:Uncharacterized protein n=1 Tax=Acetanaerobacterium elongatum TaxID=258515 RepID=A0A1H0EME2_9FIRM|nr:hypothetical protein [Acetanaerobacterium elongatum]SDN83574.1 hypothetical protein SAMN05192585_13435 [Acetanaerobacterium elongatum]
MVNIKKFVSVVLAFILIMLCMPTTYADTTVSTAIYVFSNNDGSYSTSANNSNGLRAFNNSSSQKIAKQNNDIFYFDANPNRKLIKINNSMFLEAEEINVNVKSTAAVNSIISAYSIQGKLREDLLQTNQMALSLDWESIDAQLYVPTRNTSNSNGAIYTGYNGARYKDYVYTATAQSSYYNISQLTGKISAVAAKTLQTFIVRSLGSSSASSQIGVLLTLQDIFGSLFESYPTSTSIQTQVSSCETKTRRYTYIESPVYADSFSCRAISDTGSQYFRYLTITPGQLEHFANADTCYYCGDNYYNLDEMAYSYRFGGGIEVWKETVSSFKLNAFQSFSSVNP